MKYVLDLNCSLFGIIYLLLFNRKILDSQSGDLDIINLNHMKLLFSLG